MRAAQRRPRAAGLALLVATIALARIPANGRANQNDVPGQSIVGRMGTIVPESQARRGIAFSPFAPPRVIIAVALLPPFHGDDTRLNRGIGFEYADDAGRTYALAEWPARGGTIVRFPALDPGDDGCPTARRFARGRRPSGIVWSTPHGLILTLQSDGKNDARTLQIEWQKLIRRGACR